MARLAAVYAGIVLSSLVVLAPAQAADIDNYWDGNWRSHHEGTKVMVLDLEQKRGKRGVTGTYKHPKDNHGVHGGDKGTITAEAKGEFGKRLKGTYKSNSGGGRGGFEIKLKPDLASWKGEFWPCRYRFYCDVFDWTGNKPGFD